MVLSARLQVALLAVVAIGGALAIGGPNAKLARLITGTWDLGQRQRGLPVLIVLRQDGNIYPSIWGGVNAGGTLSLTGTEELLTEDLVVKSKGGFALRVARVPPKTGMEDVLPGGQWVKEPGWSVRIEFREFNNWKRADDRKGLFATIGLSADYTGTFYANDRELPIRGNAVFNHSLVVGSFDFATNLTINGSDLGLEGDQARPIHVKIQTYTSLAKDLPAGNKELEKIEEDK
jgi:hypothetical protein